METDYTGSYKSQVPYDHDAPHLWRVYMLKSWVTDDCTIDECYMIRSRPWQYYSLMWT
jgi:hypothetical protein